MSEEFRTLWELASAVEEGGVVAVTVVTQLLLTPVC